MKGSGSRSDVRRALLLLGPSAIAARLLRAQSHLPNPGFDTDSSASDARLPNGKKQQDAILKADYEKNLKESRDLIEMARSFEEDLEKDDAFVLSLGSLKKLDNMEALIHRIRGRIKKF